MSAKTIRKTLKFHGQPETLFGIHVTNLFLTLVTLGIFSFWGRVKIRKYIWGQLEFDKDRFSYHGTGEETFKGWLKAAGIFGIPYLLFSHGPRWAGASPAMIGLGGLFALLLVVLFFPMAVVGSRRYRLSRTAWRGIRFSFRKTWKDYIPISWAGNFLTAITLGIYGPFYEMKRERFLIANTYAGNRHFDFDGNGEELLGYYLLSIFLALPTVGFSLLWYHVYKQRYIWGHTIFGKARFHCTITFGGMLKVDFLNVFLVLITLGFAFPWAQVRSINYLTQNLTLQGNAALRTLKQKVQKVNATGEELASFLDLDFDLG